MRALRIVLGSLAVLVAASPALAYTVYVTNQAEGTISIIDGKTRKVLDTVKISQRTPHNAVLSPDGKWLYTANVGGGSVSLFDTAARKEVAVIATGKGCHGITLSPDGQTVWTANVQEEPVSVVDLGVRIVTKTIKVGSRPMLVAFSKDGKKAYVSNGGAGGVSLPHGAAGGGGEEDFAG